MDVEMNIILDDSENIPVEIPGPDADEMERKILAHVKEAWRVNSGVMEPFHRKWHKYYSMYEGTYVPEKDGQYFHELHKPRLARNVNLIRANLKAMTVTNPSRLDFFEIVPDSSEQQEAMFLESACEIATKGIQSDLRQCGFLETYDDVLLDCLVTGNAYALPHWDFEIAHIYQTVPNPAYNPMMPFEIGPDGVLTPVEEFIEKRIPVRQKDAPSLRYLIPFNVFPSNLEVREIKDCENVCVYDTTTIDELRAFAIENNGMLYANVDKVKASDEQQNVEEIYQSGRNATRSKIESSDGFTNNDWKLPRITFFGRLDPERIFGDDQPAPETWAIFAEKFGIDLDEADEASVWVVEWVMDKTTMLRCQPFPYQDMGIPILHAKLNKTTRSLLGFGMYDTNQWDERQWNALNRLNMEATVRTARPPVFVFNNAIDQKWLQLHGGSYKYSPDAIIPVNQPVSAGAIATPMSPNVAALEITARRMGELDAQLNMDTYLPNVKQGLPSGAGSARETTIMNQSADAIMRLFAECLEQFFLRPMIRYFFALHRQYDRAPRLAYEFNDSGKLESFQIPPDVWNAMINVVTISQRDKQDPAVLAMNFKEFVNTYAQQGMLNLLECAKEHARILDVRRLDRLMVPDEQYQQMISAPPEPPPMKPSISVSVPFEQLSPAAQVQMLAKHMDIEVSEVEQALAQRTETMNEAVGDGHVGTLGMAERAASPPMPQRPQRFNRHGQPRGGTPNPGAMPRNHHAVNEVEKRQRGVHDHEGGNRTFGQRTKGRM